MAENYWAEVEAGPDLLIGLHPESPNASPPGTVGSIQIGLNVTEPLEAIRERLAKQGVNFLGDIVSDEGAGRFARLTDPDGNQLYFWENKPAPAIAEGN